ncbi:DUF3168 domain-containing protein [Phyllobacterium bourgognense]|uniref:Uncharacterized protein DUF3168 n=1 Tax=Phyllobacterium bourgognense TaxID=314236 RepID=A0A368YKX8_9HYPH|nr:DUF3168 domain-containing protein [Phyllobacterium bourgognense]RCW79547.1 uncharacterized protein DUF3168 [Phyllobacterium bourgognense]
MTSAGLELQKALLAHLKADGSLEKLIEGRVYDRVPEKAAFPYVTLGSTNIYDWSTGTERGSEHLFTLNIWNRASGRKSVFAIMNIIERLLEKSALTLVGHRLANLGLQYSQARAEDNRDGYLGVLRYRAVTEELPA